MGDELKGTKVIVVSRVVEGHSVTIEGEKNRRGAHSIVSWANY